MRAIPNHLPPRQSPRTYRVKETRILNLRPRLRRGRLTPQPVLCMQVNIILIKFNTSLPLGISAAQRLCESFDMAHCAVSVTVDDNMEYSTMDHAGDAGQLLRHHRIRLMQAIFQAPRDPIFQGLARIAKYLRRGFTL